MEDLNIERPYCGVIIEAGIELYPGDYVSCSECGRNYEVLSTDPVKLSEMEDGDDFDYKY